MRYKAKSITHILAGLSAATLIGCSGEAKTETNTSAFEFDLASNGWELVWSDEFDGGAIDGQKWTHEVNCQGGGNNEQQCYTDSVDNAYVSDGILNLVALPAASGADLPYTSARLVTKHKADFTYGRFEVRAKLPSGQGSWPAFWLLPTDEVYGGWPRSGEIDVVEAVNLKVADDEGTLENRIYGTLHYGQAWPDNVHSGREYALADGANPADEFHTYAVEWQEGEIRWYMDGYLYATQRQSEVRYNSKGDAVGLAHRGWFAEFYDMITGELKTDYSAAPYDQDFHMILNLAVGGDWPENVNATGVDSAAFENGQTFEIDYVRVYQCMADLETGRGCETVRAGYDSKDDALVEGKAPVPTPPAAPAANVKVFSGSINPNWPAWDCCGGSTPAVVSDPEQGSVVEFSVGATPTVNGFISREAFITDEAGTPSPFDASGSLVDGSISFDMKVTTAPNDASATWMFKVESSDGASAAELPLTASTEGVAPTTGQWQTYTFPLQALADANLDVSAIDVVMIFPAWGAGEGAVYQVANVLIGSPDEGSPQVTLFDNEINASWPMWDCCGGSTPTVELDDDAHTNVAEFAIGASPTVMGFISRSDFTDSPAPFDASGILETGVVQFEMKVTSMPNDAGAAWLFKIESNGGDTAVELPLTSSVEGVAPSAEQWMTYTFKLAALADAGLDVSAIDVVMVFPAWGAGDGAVYRIDNARIFDPVASDNFAGITLFIEQTTDKWSIWDCCGGSTPTVEDDDAAHGKVAEFVIGASPTVMGILADTDEFYDASSLLSDGYVQFDLKVVSAANDASAVWKFKIESIGASSAVELDLTASQEGHAPALGQWQTYTYSLQDLADAGLDISQINVLMVFPAWGTGEGAVYRLDNIVISAP